MPAVWGRSLPNEIRQVSLAGGVRCRIRSTILLVGAVRCQMDSVATLGVVVHCQILHFFCLVRAVRCRTSSRSICCTSGLAANLSSCYHFSLVVIIAMGDVRFFFHFVAYVGVR